MFLVIKVGTEETSQDDVQKAIDLHACITFDVFVGGCKHILSHRKSIGSPAKGWRKTRKAWDTK